MGGRKSADTLGNTMAVCRDHGRITDGEWGSGGAAQYAEAHRILFGAVFDSIPSDRIAYERAEALTRIVADG